MLMWLNRRWAQRTGLCKRAVPAALINLGLAAALSTAHADEAPPNDVEGDIRKLSPADSQRGHTTEQLDGRVVWLGDAIEQTLGIKLASETRQSVLVLLTDKGQIHPLLPDRHGQAFRLDKRLRDRKVKLLVRRHKGSPFVQVIRVFALKKEGVYELDYWCEICAIALFELRACDCCQGPVEWRERKIDPATLPVR